MKKRFIEMCISLLGFILLAPSVIAYPIMYVIWGINPIEYAALMFANGTFPK